MKALHKIVMESAVGLLVLALQPALAHESVQTSSATSAITGTAAPPTPGATTMSTI